MVDIDDFREIKQCTIKGESYSVRDNGAVFRHSREGKRMRKDDEIWTFGKSNDKGYMILGQERVHRIVAFAFLGTPPTSQHVVDHIDTNRKNNRPENLRWLTKLENALINPITVAKIEYRCGSIEKFINDPSILRSYEDEDPNFKWMRSVTPEEAKNAHYNLTIWAEERPVLKGGSLGEWIYEPIPEYKRARDIQRSGKKTKASLTPNAMQVNWYIPSEFPLCPSGSEKELKDYFENLRKGLVFCKNETYTSLVDKCAFLDETIYVLTVSEDQDSVKNWALAKITCAKGVFFHYNEGSFMSEEGALKYFTIAQGKEWSGPDTIDDYIR